MGVATAEINQPWLVNIGILYHWGYFHEVVDDLELDSFEYKLRNNLSSIFYFCFLFCFFTFLHFDFEAVLVYIQLYNYLFKT